MGATIPRPYCIEKKCCWLESKWKIKDDPTSILYTPPPNANLEHANKKPSSITFQTEGRASLSILIFTASECPNRVPRTFPHTRGKGTKNLNFWGFKLFRRAKEKEQRVKDYKCELSAGGVSSRERHGGVQPWWWISFIITVAAPGPNLFFPHPSPPLLPVWFVYSAVFKEAFFRELRQAKHFLWTFPFTTKQIKQIRPWRIQKFFRSSGGNYEMRWR